MVAINEQPTTNNELCFFTRLQRFKTPITCSLSYPVVNSIIEKINEECLSKLIELNIEQELQAEIQWCLGSYRSDNNPIGLYTMAERALIVLKDVKDSNPKLVSTKLLNDIEKALKSR